MTFLSTQHADQAPRSDLPIPGMDDQAVTFLQSVAPPTAGDRTRAFAALLRALTTPAGTR